MNRGFLRRHAVRVILAALILVSAARVISTYTVFNHTIDEPTHISCGLEWLQRHTYTYEYQHPPLARVLAAIGPWLLDTGNIQRKEDLPSKNPLVLYDSASYYATLASARAGELPFLALTAIVVFLWTKDLFGERAALCAVLLLLTLPPVLGHAGLATTDASVMAMLPCAAYALSRFAAAPNAASAGYFGVALGLGVLSKFSFLLFFPACAAVVVGDAVRKRGWPGVPGIRLWVGAALVAFGIIWSGYLWSVGAAPVPVPLSEVFLGVAEVRDHNRDGHLSFLLGEISTTGWWYFFPVVLLYKTPLAFLILCCGTPWLPRKWNGLVPLLCAIAVMALVLPSRINLGIRHLLPIYPLLAIGAGAVLWNALASKNKALRTAAAALAAWQLGASAMAHPDYFAYFNELAAGEPEEIRVDSDLDWGQNIERLGRYLHDRNIGSPVGLGLFGSVDPSRHGLNWFPISPWQATDGWVAVSATEKMLSTSRPPPGVRTRPWAWLHAHKPVARIGNGILLYYIAPHP